MSNNREKSEDYQYAIPTENSHDTSDRALDKTTCLDIIETNGSEGKSKKIDIQVYGRNIKTKSPFKIGNIFSFCYIRDAPLFTLGPHCNKITINF